MGWGVCGHGGTAVRAGLAWKATQATMLVLVCPSPGPWLPATVMGPRAGLVLECKWLWLGASPLAEGEKLLTNPPGTAEFFHMERRNVRTPGLIISLAE